MKRYLGLDVGNATIGVAVSDLLGLTAQGVETIKRKNLESDLLRLNELANLYDTSSFVIGLPKHMNGDEGERCKITREFADELKKKLPEAEIFFWDERLTTVVATKTLVAADISRKKQKKVIDKMAAILILQGYLDRMSIKRQE
ncbi:MAG: Holliday junction resolvase RuvX [Selenomonadaceae bacterium]|nr:Holliday junction resolvase RuvX [Selenomonadaceae bacterium]